MHIKDVCLCHYHCIFCVRTMLVYLIYSIVEEVVFFVVVVVVFVLK